ncbi:hypothetical protein V1511DRAFT_380506 [Dipodascopsis uninucleata]
MEIYTGNSTLYQFIKKYRQPVFLERNLKCFLDHHKPGGLSQLYNHDGAGDAGSVAHNWETGNSIPSQDAREENSRGNSAKRGSRIEGICDKLMALSTKNLVKKNSVDKYKIQSLVLQPFLKIEVTELVKMARSLRSQALPSLKLRVTNCRCCIQIYKGDQSVEKQLPEDLLFYSSESCTLIPKSDVDQPLESQQGVTADLVMEEPVYVKFSSLSESGFDSLLTSLETEKSFSVIISIRSVNDYSYQSWPFNVDLSPAAGTPSRTRHSTPMSRTNSSCSSPTSSPRRQSTRKKHISSSAINKNSHRVVSPSISSRIRRLTVDLERMNDTDPDEKSDDKLSAMDIRGRFQFSLAECPDSGYIVPLDYYHGSQKQIIRNGPEIGVKIDLGWGALSDVGTEIDGGSNDLEQGASLSNTDVTETDRDFKIHSSQSAGNNRYLSIPDKVEARYHFAVDGKFKTYKLSGFKCPWCANKDYGHYERLNFHFLTYHELFTFRLELRKPQLMDIYVSLTGEFLYERAGPKVPDLRLFQWIQPRSMRFKIERFNKGDHSWVQTGFALMAAQMPILPMTSGLMNGGHHHTASYLVNIYAANQTNDSSSNSLMGLDGGLAINGTRLYGNEQDGMISGSSASVHTSQWHDIQTVPELPAKTRRVFTVPETESPLFKTKSKKPLKPGEDVSESEDDTDDSWLLHKHEETIDDFEDVSSIEKKFIKIWDRHIMEERPSSYKHVTDSLARFVRNNKIPLKERDLQIEFWKHCLNLIDCGIIEPASLYSCMKYIKSENESSASVSDFVSTTSTSISSISSDSVAGSSISSASHLKSMPEHSSSEISDDSNSTNDEGINEIDNVENLAMRNIYDCENVSENGEMISD